MRRSSIESGAPTGRRRVKALLHAAAFVVLLAGFSVQLPNLAALDLTADAHAAGAPVAGGAGSPVTAEDPVTIDWRTLGMLDYSSGNAPPTLKALDGKRVKVPGFVVPLEDYVEEGNEFLLVPYFGACVHVPPPPPNQIVFVKMEGGKKVKWGWWEPIWIEGTLQIKKVQSIYGAAGYEMTGLKVTPYDG